MSDFESGAFNRALPPLHLESTTADMLIEAVSAVVPITVVKPKPAYRLRLHYGPERDACSTTSSIMTCGREALQQFGTQRRPSPVYWQSCDGGNATCTRSPWHPQEQTEAIRARSEGQNHSSSTFRISGSRSPRFPSRDPTDFYRQGKAKGNLKSACLS